MAYTKTEWATGDTITAEKLNHAESGIAAAGAVVCTDTDGTLDKTYNDLKTIMEAGNIAILIDPYSALEEEYTLWLCTDIYADDGVYTATFANVKFRDSSTITNSNDYKASDPDVALVFS